jgi:hypothetical protein
MRPSNHMVIWIFPGAFMAFESNSGASSEMRPFRAEKQLC